MVKNKSFSGSYDTNSYFFETFNLSNISVLVNNVPIPIRPLTLNFDGYDNLLPYYMMFPSTGIAGQDHGLTVTSDLYKDGGYSLLSFDLKPIIGSEAFLQLEKGGSVSIEIKFSKALTEAVTLLIYSETQGLIEIDQFRQVTTQ